MCFQSYNRDRCEEDLQWQWQWQRQRPSKSIAIYTRANGSERSYRDHTGYLSRGGVDCEAAKPKKELERRQFKLKSSIFAILPLARTRRKGLWQKFSARHRNGTERNATQCNAEVAMAMTISECIQSKRMNCSRDSWLMKWARNGNVECGIWSTRAAQWKQTATAATPTTPTTQSSFNCILGL